MYAYFAIDPAFKKQIHHRALIEVEYFDSDKGELLRIQYDSFDRTGKKDGAYTESKDRLIMDGSQTWRVATFQLEDARFEGRQNGDADFRVAVGGNRFYLGKVAVKPF